MAILLKKIKQNKIKKFTDNYVGTKGNIKQVGFIVLYLFVNTVLFFLLLKNEDGSIAQVLTLC